MDAIAAEKKAAASILPSRPMSKIPVRSEKRPARQANNNGIAKRTVASRIWMSVKNPSVASLTQGKEYAFQWHTYHIVQRACEKDNQRLDDHDQPAWNAGPQCQLGTALV